MSLLSKIISEPPRPQNSFLVLLSSVAQSGLPVLRQLLSSKLISDNTGSTRFLLFCFCYPATDLLESFRSPPDFIEVHDWVGHVPEYDVGQFSPREAILSAIRNTSPSGCLDVIIDCLDTLSSDIGSTPQTYMFLREVLALAPDPSRLILHGLKTCKLAPLLMQPAFSPSLVCLLAHPSVLITHLAREYLTPPPPASSDSKFWGVFLPVSERDYECERLVFGNDGEGSGSTTEFVLEVLVRSLNGSGRKRGVERTLEGWSSIEGGTCELTKLESLKTLWRKSEVMVESEGRGAPDVVNDISFNLTLTASQHQSRARVPLPYSHDGKGTLNNIANSSAVILYDPDSADDIDDDDPDEDLDI
ncbi:hypothetical protein L208DRAFT_1421463 [Tricholoma matsutake]|nr:hypothetical protein L208DRAFT_1421463 [Tricholoma matsutake 945]